MKKIALTLSILFSANLASAHLASQARSELCRRWYSRDIFKTYLRLAVTPALSSEYNPTLWMDTHIPYGIRPLNYDITSLKCSANKLHIFATAPIANVEFVFNGVEDGPEIQNGTLSYFDNSGNSGAIEVLECSSSAIKQFCSTQNKAAPNPSEVP